MKKTSLVLALLIVSASSAFAAQIPGSQYFYLGSGISYFPLGSSGVADFMRMESNLYNPAALADTKRITSSLSLGGFGGDNFILNFSASFPTTVGIITGNVLALTSPSGVTAGDVIGLKGTFSKPVSEQWLFGAAVNVGFANDGPQRDFLTSVDLGTIYRKEVGGTGFGFFDHSVGLALKNIGKNISYAGYDAFPPFEADLGLQAEVIRQGVYRARLFTHAAVPVNPVSFFAGVGLENIFFDMVNIKFGMGFGVEDVVPFSAGVDLNFDIKDTGVQLSYSLLPTDFNGSRQIVHNAGINVAFGTYDKKPPEASVDAEREYFSPNHDGINDRAKLDITISDNTMAFGWKLDITDVQGRPVKSFEAKDVRKIRKMTFAKYFKRVFSKKQEVEIPKFIEWDGEDSEGNVVPDGQYSYVLTAWDENNNKIVTKKRWIIVDNVTPIVEAEAKELLFSPNDDGVKDTLDIAIKSANIEKNDTVIIRISDRDKNTVLEEKKTGSVPEIFEWNGRDQSGALVREGVYKFTIAASDFADNRTESSVDGIVVRTEYEKISASPVLKAFSPNGDGYSDMDDIRLFSSGTEGLINWDLRIVDEKGAIVREYSGTKVFPDVINFDGKDSEGVVLPDGLYSLEFRLFFESGNHPESFYKFIRIDNTPPAITVSSNITAFSPNGDGVKDTMNIVHNIKSGEGDIFEAKIVNAAGGTFKTFEFGTNPPKVIVWDGIGDNNTQPVEGIYTYIITGRDRVGNSTIASLGPIKLVTGFEEVAVEPDEYIISPNGDGIKDSAAFKLHASSMEGIVEWKLDIRDRNNTSVRSFNNQNMGQLLPTEVVWDGKTDTGAQADDGLYSAVLSVLYDAGNNPISKPKDIRIDTQAPSIEVYVEDLNISPNNDGAKETLTIYQRMRGDKDDTYTGEIRGPGGAVVKSFNWVGNPPVEIVWDGRDDSGNPLAEGIYSYSVRGEDAAGNKAEESITDIVLTTEYEKVSLLASERGISPNNDGAFDAVVFTPVLTSEKGLISWSIGIIDSQSRLIRKIDGNGTPPAAVTWDGTGEDGSLVPDGEYGYTMRLTYESGNHPESKPGTITVDTKAPEYLFVVSPKLFSPDEDGEADTLYMNAEIGDKNGVREWDITLYRVWDGKPDRSTPLKRYTGRGSFKKTLHWDGFSDPVRMPEGFTPPDFYTYKKVGNKWEVLVDSASNYIAELRASDMYNNSITVTRSFGTDILVIKTSEGLKIMINSIQFEFDKSDLLPQSFPILDRLIEILDKFPAYKIRVVGHTDSIGSDEYNQKLSERRAFSVYKYLVAHDIDKDRLTTEGKGEKMPIDDNGTEAGRARNRRVEFYLTR